MNNRSVHSRFLLTLILLPRFLRPLSRLSDLLLEFKVRVDSHQLCLNSQKEGVAPKTGLTPDTVTLETGAGILLYTGVELLKEGRREEGGRKGGREGSGRNGEKGEWGEQW